MKGESLPGLILPAALRLESTKEEEENSLPENQGKKFGRTNLARFLGARLPAARHVVGIRNRFCFDEPAPNIGR